jgi:PPOX class probable F420-dependent enzyme
MATKAVGHPVTLPANATRPKEVNVMPAPKATDTPALARERFIRVTTFKRDGTPVATPVWCAGDNGSLLVFTEANSGKVKRLRHDPRVSVAPCSARGKPLGPAVDGDAEIVDDTVRVEALLDRKYGWVWAAYNLLTAAVRGVRRQPPPKAVTLRITLR